MQRSNEEKRIEIKTSDVGPCAAEAVFSGQQGFMMPSAVSNIIMQKLR